MSKILFLPFLIFALTAAAAVPRSSDDIIGRWMSIENNLEVEVFKAGNEYKARVIWFDDSDDKNRPMNTRCDRENPNEALRTRRIIGLEVMNGLVYNAGNNEWQDGRIYDSNKGKNWSAKAWLTKDGWLKVRGFWHFQFLGQNIWFKKVT